MFYEMCGVGSKGSKTHRSQELCAVRPLENGAAFEVVDGKQVWHPVWDDRVDHNVNVQFLEAVVKCVWDNEEVIKYCPWKYALTPQLVEASCESCHQ